MKQGTFNISKFADIMSWEVYQELLEKYMAWHKEKYPSTADHLISEYKTGYRTTKKGTNYLTRSVQDYVKFVGGFCERTNVTGIFVDESKIVTDTLGFKRKIGSAHWRKSAGTVGSSDLKALMWGGIPVHIEIKYGRDSQSPEQKKYQAQIESVGGRYLIVKKLDDLVDYIKQHKLMKEDNK